MGEWMHGLGVEFMKEYTSNALRVYEFVEFTPLCKEIFHACLLIVLERGF